MMSIDENPYASPEADGDRLHPTLGQDDAEQVRRYYLKHETSVKSVGLLYYLSGAFLAIGFAGIMTATMSSGSMVGPLEAAIVAIYGLLAAASFVVGRGLRKLRTWVRTPAGIMSGIGLLGVPIGTLINGYILYLLFCQKGSIVLSREYQEIIRQTPHIKYKTPLVIWILLGVLVVLLIVAAMAAGFVG